MQKSDLLQPGQGVRRINTKDSTLGRTGNIVARLDGRAQVYWLFDSTGRPIANSSSGLGVNTKVRFEDLELLGEPVSLEAAKQEWNDNIDAGKGPRNAKKVKL